MVRPLLLDIAYNGEMISSILNGTFSGDLIFRGGPESVVGLTDRGPYDSVWKHVSCLPLRFSLLARATRPAASKRDSILQGTARRGLLRSGSLCASCLASILDATVTLFYSHEDCRRYRRHEGCALQCEICIPRAPYRC